MSPQIRKSSVEIRKERTSAIKQSRTLLRKNYIDVEYEKNLSLLCEMIAQKAKKETTIQADHKVRVFKSISDFALKYALDFAGVGFEGDGRKRAAKLIEAKFRSHFQNPQQRELDQYLQPLTVNEDRAILRTELQEIVGSHAPRVISKYFDISRRIIRYIEKGKIVDEKDSLDKFLLKYFLPRPEHR
ncbi:MAG TPA: hypothetical protein VJG83_04050 [archaeon]|nr:hypothetical protein [archaeon]